MEKRVVIIDHADSFTFNIAETVRKIEGKSPQIVSYKSLSIDWQGVSHVILSPGPGTLDEYKNTFQWIEKYYRRKKILGICLGFQQLAGFFGAEFVRNEFPVHGQGLEVTLKDDSFLFRDLPEKIQAGFYHSWHVEKLPEVLKLTAVDEKGHVSAFEHVQFPVFGVQFHPESFLTPKGLQIIKNFLNG